MNPHNPDSTRNRATYLEFLRRRRDSVVTPVLKFGDAGGMGRRITPAADTDGD